MLFSGYKGESMIFSKVFVVCAVFLTGLFVSLQIFAGVLLEPDPSFERRATFYPIDGGEIHVGDIDKDKKTFRLHLRHFGKSSEWVYYYAEADIFTDKSGKAEPDNAEACIEYPQYTTSIIGDTFRRVRVRILFDQRGKGDGFFKVPGHVIYQKCTTNINKKENWNCTGWEYLGRLPGF